MGENSISFYNPISPSFTYEVSSKPLWNKCDENLSVNHANNSLLSCLAQKMQLMFLFFVSSSPGKINTCYLPAGRSV